MEPVQHIALFGGLSKPGVFRLFTSLLPFVMIALGVLHFHDCPKQPYIPIYLIVGGVVYQLVNILSCLNCTQGEGLLSALCRACNALLYLFLFCWLITGSVWIYVVFPPNFESSNSEDYCEKILYQFAFWGTNGCYVSIVLGTISSCCSFLYKSLGGT